MAVRLGAKPPRPLLGTGSPQMGDGDRLDGLAGEFQYPLPDGQPECLGLGVERGCLPGRQGESDGHGCDRMIFGQRSWEGLRALLATAGNRLGLAGIPYA